MADFTLITSDGLFGQNLTATGNGLKDIDGDGTADVNLAIVSSTFAALDATSGFGLGVAGQDPPVWRRSTDGTVVADGTARDEAYWGRRGPFRGNIANSDDNWSKVNFSSGDGWVQWRFGSDVNTVIPLLFVREAEGVDLSAAQAYFAAYLPPTDLALNNSSVAENSPIGTVVGNFSTTDNSLSGFTYTLVSGSGDTDNSAFTIVGNQLKLAISPDFETKSSYSIRVKTTDPDNQIYEKPFTISITDVVENTAPTDLALSTPTVNENVPASTLIGSFSTTDAEGGSFTYTLVSGTGSTDNGLFTINGNQLKISTSPNFEAKSSYSIRVKTTDAGGLFYEEAFTINVSNVNEAPTGISLSASTVAENVSVGTIVGNFSTTDPEGGSFTYSFVSGTGDSDNAAFSIDGNQLKLAVSPNFEAKSSYSIRVKTTDADGLFYEKALAISVNDVNEAPIANDDSGFTAGAGIPKSIDITSLLSNDKDPDANSNLSITAVTSTTGTVAIDGSKIIFTANANNTSGSASFDYTLSDGSLTDTATVTLAIGRTFNGGNGKDTLNGTAGDDIINGFNGADILNGGAGDDRLNGGNGPDVLTGGTGRDTFVLAKNAGGDTITDFEIGIDSIGLTDGLSFGQLTVSGSGGNTLIRLGSETLTTLIGVNASLITAAAFSQA